MYEIPCSLFSGQKAASGLHLELSWQFIPTVRTKITKISQNLILAKKKNTEQF